jgi:hypothetical protein
VAASYPRLTKSHEKTNKNNMMQFKNGETG